MSFDPLGLSVGIIGAIVAALLPVEWGVLAILLVQQMPWAGEIASLGGVSLRPPDLAAGVWLLKTAIHLRRSRIALTVLRTAPVVLAATWAVWLLVATLAAHWREGDSHGGAQLVSLARLYAMMLIVPFLSVVLSSAKPERVRGLVALVLAMAAIQALLAFSRWAPDAFIGVDWIAALGFTEEDRWFVGRDALLAFPMARQGRWTGTFGDPAPFGDFMVLGLAAAWALARTGGSRATWVLAAVLVAATGLSLTRAAWVGLVLLAVAGFFLAGRVRPAGPERRRWIGFLALGCAGWVALLSAQSAATWVRAQRSGPPAVAERVDSRPAATVSTQVPSVTPAQVATEDTPVGSAAGSVPRASQPGWIDRLQSRLRLRIDRSAEGRLTMIRLGLEQFAEHPVTGVGWTGARFHGMDLPWGEPLYTRLLAEAGFPGLVLFLATLAAGLRAAWQGLTDRDRGTIALAWFGGLGLVAMMGFMTADLLILGPSFGSAALFMLLGCVAAAGKRAAAAVAAPAPPG